MDKYINDLLDEINFYRYAHGEMINRSNDEYSAFFISQVETNESLNVFFINWSEVVETFNQTLKHVRTKYTNLSQVELAYLLDVSPFSVSSWESEGNRKSLRNKKENDTTSSIEKRSDINKTLWRIGRRLPSIEQAYILSRVTDIGLNHYFLDANFEKRINMHNRITYLLSLIEKDEVANKETFFTQIAPTIENYLKNEEAYIADIATVVSDVDIKYYEKDNGLDIFTNETLGVLQHDFLTTISCYVLKIFTNDDLLKIYERMANKRISFYFKNTFKILLRELTDEPYSGIEFKTNLTRFFAYIQEDDYKSNCTKTDYDSFISYFENCSNYLQACDIIHFEVKQRSNYLKGLSERYNKLKELYGSSELSQFNYGKREFLNKLGIQFNEDNLEDTYEKAIELLSPIAKNMKFDNKE